MFFCRDFRILFLFYICWIKKVAMNRTRFKKKINLQQFTRHRIVDRWPKKTKASKIWQPFILPDSYFHRYCKSEMISGKWTVWSVETGVLRKHFCRHILWRSFARIMIIIRKAKIAKSRIRDKFSVGVHSGVWNVRVNLLTCPPSRGTVLLFKSMINQKR